MYALYTQYWQIIDRLECFQPDGKGSPNLTSSAACNMWTMPHKTQVLGIDTQHPFNRNTPLLPSDLSIFHSYAGKSALLAPETKTFAGSYGHPCSASAHARCSLN